MEQGCIFEEDTKLNLQEMELGCIFEEDTEINLKEMKQGCIFEEDTELTVLKTSLFYSGDGFSVYDSKGDIVFRVDSYGSDVRDRDELFLMDASGKCAVTVRRKRPSLHQRWEGYLGERIEGKKPIFSVRRSSILGRCSVTVEVFGDPAEDYQIEGSFCQRSCRFLNSARDMVAEIKRKMDGPAHVVFGKDVFALWVKPGVDATFVMALVLVLDHINGAEDWYDGDDEEDAATEPHTRFLEG